MYRLATGLHTSERSHLLAAAGWVLWAIFVGMWVAALVPFYARGMHLFSNTSLGYAGEPSYGGSGIPYAPTFDDVYGTSSFSSLAQSVVCYGPFVFFLVVGGALLRLLTAWRSYSSLGITLRIVALLVTLVLLVLSYDMAGRFLIWGLG